MNILPRLHTLLLSTALFTVSGCAILNQPVSTGDDPKQTRKSGGGKTTTVTIEAAPVPGQEKVSDVEILWQIPKEPVDGFVIRYGANQYQLSQEVRIASAGLEKVDDQLHGSVYRYVLADVPLEERVYLTVSAFSGEKVSSPSPTFEVSAQ